jgi:hypothetical protein
LQTVANGRCMSQQESNYETEREKLRVGTISFSEFCNACSKIEGLSCYIGLNDENNDGFVLDIIEGEELKERIMLTEEQYETLKTEGIEEF